MMKKWAFLMVSALLFVSAGQFPLSAEETLPPKLKQLTDEAYRAYSARETDNFLETVQDVK